MSKQDVLFKKHGRARRYVARIDANANIVVTIPVGGSQREALSFANAHRDWLEEQKKKARQALSDAGSGRGLKAGDFVWYRGRRIRLRVVLDWGRPVLLLGGERIFIADANMDLSKPLVAHLRQLAKTELPARVMELAAAHRVQVSKVVVRDQKTRWGSCSTNRTISLNWRLLLAPEATRDYVVIHELMHLKRFDHSAAFWRLVAAACPEYRQHESWLSDRQNELNW